MSALDLNDNALPFPGKRPYPNALFADADVDHDGDGLHGWVEHKLWWEGGHKYPLDYSDGDQTTAPSPTGAAIWNDWDYDGILSDDERDWDRDGLANIYEYFSADFQPWEPSFPGTLRARLAGSGHGRRRRARRLRRPGSRRRLERRGALERDVADEPVRPGNQPHLPALARGGGLAEAAQASVHHALGAQLRGNPGSERQYPDGYSRSGPRRATGRSGTDGAPATAHVPLRSRCAGEPLASAP